MRQLKLLFFKPFRCLYEVTEVDETVLSRMTIATIGCAGLLATLATLTLS